MNTKAWKQEIDNIMARTLYTDAMDKLGVKGTFDKLRSCNARVYSDGERYILFSYTTAVACVVKFNNEFYAVDVLRTVYGYTATSAQHINKFFKDYAPENSVHLTYRDIK